METTAKPTLETSLDQPRSALNVKVDSKTTTVSVLVCVQAKLHSTCLEMTSEQLHVMETTRNSISPENASQVVVAENTHTKFRIMACESNALIWWQGARVVKSEKKEVLHMQSALLARKALHT